MPDPKRLALVTPETPDWLVDIVKNVPAPLVHMDAARSAGETDDERDERLTVETIPKAYLASVRGAPHLRGLKLGRQSGFQNIEPVAADWVLDTAAKKPSMMFAGPLSGVGKSVIACACLREWQRENHRFAMFVHSFKLGVIRIQTAAGTGEAELVRRAMSAPLILIDDLGSEKMTKSNAMEDVVFDRHSNEKPIWVTTGLTYEQIANRYGDGFLRRITERTTTIVVGAQKS